MKRIAIVLIFGLLLGGCTTRAKPVARVVTGVQVEYQQHGNTLLRTYTKQENIRSVLTYLRMIRPFGPVIPEGSHEITCLFTLRYSHGPDSVIVQQGHDYLRRNDGDWEQIDQTQAQLLYPLLLLLPSDL